LERLFRRVRPATSAADALPLLAAVALALQLLLPLWHAAELPAEASCADGAACAVDHDAPGEAASDAERSTPTHDDTSLPATPDHDPRTCPTCQWLTFVKTFTAPTLVPAAEVIEANQWRLVDAAPEQVHAVAIPLAHSARGPPSC
jgi:hypothetical protein